MAGGMCGWGVCVVGGMHGRGMHDRGVGGMSGWGLHMAGGMHGRVHAWRGAWMAGEVCVAGGHAW